MSRLFADTSQIVEDELIYRLSQVSPWRRLEMVVQLNDGVRQMMLAGLRHQYPQDSPEQQTRRLFDLLYGTTITYDIRQLRENDSMSITPIDTMTTVADTLNDLGIEYVIGGSMASAYYGVSRSTLDVDFVADIKPEHVPALVKTLGRDFYLDEQMIRGAIEHKSSFNLIHLPTMFKVDVFIPGTRPFDHLQLQRRVSSAIGLDGDRRIYLSTPEDIVLAKLDWFNRGGRLSERQWHDILGVLLTQKGQLDILYLRENAANLGVEDILRKAFQESGTE